MFYLSNVQTSPGAAASLMKELDSFAVLAAKSSGTFRLTSDNVAVQVVSMSRSQPAAVSFPNRSDDANNWVGNSTDAISLTLTAVQGIASGEYVTVVTAHLSLRLVSKFGQDFCEEFF